MNDRELIGLALGARENAYCMYSGIAVGAALLADSGKIYLGANIENASFSPTVCAERVAFFEAINKGERRFKKIAIAGAPWGKRPSKPFYPCGVCRQVMTEFCTEDFEIIVSTGDSYEKYTLKDLMPHGFSGELL